MGRMIAVALIALIAIASIGFYLDWWRLSKTSHAGEVDITLSVHKDKIKKDADAAVERVRKTGDNVREKTAELVDRATVHGKVASVDVVAGALTVVPDKKGENITVRTNEKTVIKRNDEVISLGEVQVEQPVMVVYATEEGQRVARSITVETK